MKTVVVQCYRGRVQKVFSDAEKFRVVVIDYVDSDHAGQGFVLGNIAVENDIAVCSLDKMSKDLSIALAKFDAEQKSCENCSSYYTTKKCGLCNIDTLSEWTAK